MWPKVILVIGLVLACTSVALGAFGAHGLKAVLSETQLATFETAVRYQMYHALALLALCATMNAFHAQKWRVGCVLLAAGIVTFSGSLYLYLASGIVGFAMITPLGGGALILGWLWLIVAAWQGR